MSHIESLLSNLREHFPNSISNIYDFRDETTVTVPREHLRDIAIWLRDDLTARFQMLTDVTALDWYPREPRYDMLYAFLSLESKSRLRLRVQLSSWDANAPSLASVYASANAYEREVYDLFGINFADHPFLHRIILPDHTQGHPLRRDHPLGYEAVEFTHTHDEIQPDKPNAVRPPQARELIGSARGSPVEIPVVLADPKTPWTNEESNSLLINLGPHHPATHGVLRVALEVDGERIVNALPDIGYLTHRHRKECRVQNVPQGDTAL